MLQPISSGDIYSSENISANLKTVLKHPDIWQASKKAHHNYSIPSGYSALDSALHINGWPTNKLTEILLERPHIGEMRLVLPSIAKAMETGGWLFLIEPPFNPYAPSWIRASINIERMVVIQSCEERDWLWAAEQVMGDKAIACCLFWPVKDHLSNKILKRLQLAAKEGSRLNFIFRTMTVANQSSSASLRLIVKNNLDNQTAHQKIGIEILKQSGGWSGQKLAIKLCSESFNQ